MHFMNNLKPHVTSCRINLIDFNITLLQIQLCWYKANSTKDITLSGEANVWSEFLATDAVVPGSRRYQTFREVVGVQRGPLSLVRKSEELLEWKVSAAV
jgi:hypothetical protein